MALCGAGLDPVGLGVEWAVGLRETTAIVVLTNPDAAATAGILVAAQK